MTDAELLQAVDEELGRPRTTYLLTELRWALQRALSREDALQREVGRLRGELAKEKARADEVCDLLEAGEEPPRWHRIYHEDEVRRALEDGRSVLLGIPADDPSEERVAAVAAEDELASGVVEECGAALSDLILGAKRRLTRAEKLALPRDPAGHVRNCALQNGDDEHCCQMCRGICPDGDPF